MCGHRKVFVFFALEGLFFVAGYAVSKEVRRAV